MLYKCGLQLSCFGSGPGYRKAFYIFWGEGTWPEGTTDRSNLHRTHVGVKSSVTCVSSVLVDAVLGASWDFFVIKAIRSLIRAGRNS